MRSNPENLETARVLVILYTSKYQGHVWVSLLKQHIDLLASWKSQDFVTY
ncbi:hypothetical protein Hanom_Chr09g00759391 [Helianthus anomalus]